jgi:phosphate transport system permease protein
MSITVDTEGVGSDLPPIPPLKLKRSFSKRIVKDRVATTLIYGAFILALIPLIAVLATTVIKGLARLDPDFFTHTLRNIGPRDAGGGAMHAIVGTIEQVGIATAIAVPIGLLAAIYLVEFQGGRITRLISLLVDVLTGLPSIVSGLFILSFFILALGGSYAGIYGALALSILMLPVVIRSTEEMLRLVPNSLREASAALGTPRWRTVVRVVLPTAATGIVTGIMLAVARVAGETAPLLLTVSYTTSLNVNPFSGPQSSLPLMIYNEASKGLPTATNRAWTAALVLIAFVMILNIAARLIARRTSVRR